MGNHRRLFVCCQQPIDGRDVNTRHERMRWLALTCLLIGCSSSTRPLPPVSPVPTIPGEPGVVAPPSASVRTFNYMPGTRHYQVLRSAIIESSSDSGGAQRETSANTTNELLSLVTAGDSGASFTAVIDSFSTTSHGPIGPLPPLQLPVQVAGLFSRQGLTINSDISGGGKCNPVLSTLVSDLRVLLTRFPTGLSPGSAWRDSVESSGCQAAIPTTSRMVSTYVVSGDANYEGRRVLMVQRSDTIQARGEGGQQQHSMMLEASGTGKALYYLNTEEGSVVRITAEQNLSLMITASGKTRQFRQSSRQDFRLVP